MYPVIQFWNPQYSMLVIFEYKHVVKLIHVWISLIQIPDIIFTTWIIPFPITVFCYFSVLVNTKSKLKPELEKLHFYQIWIFKKIQVKNKYNPIKNVLGNLACSACMLNFGRDYTILELRQWFVMGHPATYLC